FEEGMITAQERKEADDAPIKVYAVQDIFRETSPYVTEHIRRDLVARYGNELLLNDGLKVYATVDLEREHDAIAATIKGVIEADKRQGFRGPLLNLKKKDWDDFTKKEQAFLEGEGKRDEVIAALIPSGEKESAKSRVGDQEGAIPLEQAAWARKPNPELNSEYTKITTLRPVLSAGDGGLGRAPEAKGAWALGRGPPPHRHRRRPPRAALEAAELRRGVQGRDSGAAGLPPLHEHAGDPDPAGGRGEGSRGLGAQPRPLHQDQRGPLDGAGLLLRHPVRADRRLRHLLAAGEEGEDDLPAPRPRPRRTHPRGSQLVLRSLDGARRSPGLRVCQALRGPGAGDDAGDGLPPPAAHAGRLQAAGDRGPRRRARETGGRQDGYDQRPLRRLVPRVYARARDRGLGGLRHLRDADGQVRHRRPLRPADLAGLHAKGAQGSAAGRVRVAQ